MESTILKAHDTIAQGKKKGVRFTLSCIKKHLDNIARFFPFKLFFICINTKPSC